MTTYHKNLKAGNLHVPGYVRTSDPGVVGSGIVWVDKSAGTGNWKIKIRNDSDDGWETSNIDGPILASQVELAEDTSPIIDDVQDWLNYVQSAGYLRGGNMIAESGNGKLTVTGGTGFFKVENSGSALTKLASWVTTTGINLTDSSTNYVFVNYNSGNPYISVSTLASNDGRTKFGLGRVFREGTDIHVVQAGLHPVETYKRIQSRTNAIEGAVKRASGMVISETGTRNIATTAGVFYAGFTRHTTPAMDTSDPGTDFEYYYLENGVWTETEASQIDNLQYNDISTPDSEALATLSNNFYGVHWVYVDIDGHILVVYGQDEYSKVSDAETAALPVTGYGHIDDAAMLVGKIIIAKSASTFTEVENVQDVTFSYVPVTEHDDLAGLADDDHTQYLLADGTRALSGNLDVGDNDINNVGDIGLDSLSADNGTGPIYVNQVADDYGVEILGYDDENDDYLKMYIDQYGISRIYSRNQAIIQSDTSFLRLNSQSVIYARLGDDAGLNSFNILNSGSYIVAHIDSDGDATFSNITGSGTFAFDGAVDIRRTVEIALLDNDTALSTGDDFAGFYWCVPYSLDGYNITNVDFWITTSGSTESSFQLYNVTDAVDILSTNCTIDATEFTSYSASTPAVIDTAHDDLDTGDLIRFDCDSAGTGATGCGVILVVEK